MARKYKRGLKGGQRTFLRLSEDAREHLGKIAEEVTDLARKTCPVDTGALRSSLVARQSGKKYLIRMLRYGLLIESGGFSKARYRREGGRGFLRAAMTRVMGAWVNNLPLAWNFADVK